MNLRWYLGGTAVAAAIGWLAAVWHLSGWAPVGLLSLAVGGGLGICVAKLAAGLGVSCPKRLVVGTLLFALVTVFVEHAWLYRDFRRQWHEARANHPQVAMFRADRPWSPAEYVRHEATAGQIELWFLDASLIAIGAVGTVLIRRRSGNQGLVAADDATDR